MRKFNLICFGLFVVTLASLTNAHTAQAEWYSGNRRGSATGVKALIYTPATAPTLVSYGEDNWVSLPLPNWMQAGWRYWVGWTFPKKYVEYNTSNAYQFIDSGGTSWNTSDRYRVEYCGASTWCAYINDMYILGIGPLPNPPIEVQAFSEVHGSSQNQLNTRFSQVSYRDTSNTWRNFDQGNWRVDAPYHVEENLNYYYRNWGP